MPGNLIEAYPLCWPVNRPRTARYKRERARFDMSFARARDEVVRQIEMMCGKYEHDRRQTGLVISTNIALRRDGLPLASQRQPEDPGVAVYFNYRKRPMCFACDRWEKVEDNMQAVAKTIDALRGIARWGTGDMMEAAFTGFTALPAPGQTTARSWRDVLGVADMNPPPTLGYITSAYKLLRSKHHPDKGGRSEDFNAIQTAYEQACQEIGE